MRARGAVLRAQAERGANPGERRWLGASPRARARCRPCVAPCRVLLPVAARRGRRCRRRRPTTSPSIAAPTPRPPDPARHARAARASAADAHDGASEGRAAGAARDAGTAASRRSTRPPAAARRGGAPRRGRCTNACRPTASRYTSDSAEGNPRWVPLWTLGYPSRRRRRASGAGAAWRHPRRCAASTPAAPPAPRGPVRIPACTAPAPGSATTAMRCRRPKSARAWSTGATRSARASSTRMPSERDTLRVEERGINARLDNDCGAIDAACADCDRSACARSRCSRCAAPRAQDVVIYRCTDACGALTVQNDVPCPKGTKQQKQVIQPPPPMPAYRPRRDTAPATVRAAAGAARAGRGPRTRCRSTSPTPSACRRRRCSSATPTTTTATSSEDATPQPRCVPLQTTGLQRRPEHRRRRRLPDGHRPVPARRRRRGLCDAWKQRLREAEAAWSSRCRPTPTQRREYERVQRIVRDSTCAQELASRRLEPACDASACTRPCAASPPLRTRSAGTRHPPRCTRR